MEIKNRNQINETNQNVMDMVEKLDPNIIKTESKINKGKPNLYLYRMKYIVSMMAILFLRVCLFLFLMDYRKQHT